MLKKLEMLVLVLLVLFLVMVNRNLRKQVTSEEIEISHVGKIIVLDAGHGGKDPGKIGVSGALEKDINLQIVMKIKAFLEEKNYQVVLTTGNDSESKKEDMKRRVDVINETNPFLAVSIHQNSFSDPSVSGAQVFYYSESKEGEVFAKQMQSALLAVDEKNMRQAKADDSYYLLKRTKVPTIIVECGFMSNPQEEEKLKTEEYQEAISNAIVAGIESCFGN